MENNLISCADCKEFEKPVNCKKFSNLFSKVFEFFFRADRQACIDLIKEKGYEEFAKEMAAKNLVCLKR